MSNFEILFQLLSQLFPVLVNLYILNDLQNRYRRQVRGISEASRRQVGGKSEVYRVQNYICNPFRVRFWGPSEPVIRFCKDEKNNIFSQKMLIPIVYLKKML